MCEMPQSLSLTWRLPPTCPLTWIVLLNPYLTQRWQPTHSWTWSHWPVQWVHWLISCLQSHTDELGGCSCCWLANTDTLLTPFLCLNYSNGLTWNTDTLRQWYYCLAPPSQPSLPFLFPGNTTVGSRNVLNFSLSGPTKSKCQKMFRRRDRPSPGLASAAPPWTYRWSNYHSKTLKEQFCVYWFAQYAGHEDSDL